MAAERAVGWFQSPQPLPRPSRLPQARSGYVTLMRHTFFVPINRFPFRRLQTLASRQGLGFSLSLGRDAWSDQDAGQGARFVYTGHGHITGHLHIPEKASTTEKGPDITKINSSHVYGHTCSRPSRQNPGPSKETLPLGPRLRHPSTPARTQLSAALPPPGAAPETRWKRGLAAQRGPPAAGGSTREQVEGGPGRSGGRGAPAQMKWIQLSSHSPRGMCSAWLRHVRL